MTNESRMWDLIEDAPTCMFVTHDPSDGLRARPMHAVVERDRGEIWFYTRLESGKSAELSQDGSVCLCFARPSKNDYVSVTGQASLSKDKAMIDRHWSRFVDAWFPEGKDGPDVAMIRVAPERGEFWDGESSDVLAALKMVRASMKDERPQLGRHEKVSL